ncbi:hypothetical protein J6590_084791 [Homalodisca vitripennis]|nr:hypothetical protein J6590_084791 [Homalodisca vitripennis]
MVSPVGKERRAEWLVIQPGVGKVTTKESSGVIFHKHQWSHLLERRAEWLVIQPGVGKVTTKESSGVIFYKHQWSHLLVRRGELSG